MKIRNSYGSIKLLGLLRKGPLVIVLQRNESLDLNEDILLIILQNLHFRKGHVNLMQSECQLVEFLNF